MRKFYDDFLDEALAHPVVSGLVVVLVILVLAYVFLN
jgi:hypothetical protein